MLFSPSMLLLWLFVVVIVVAAFSYLTPCRCGCRNLLLRPRSLCSYDYVAIVVSHVPQFDGVAVLGDVIVVGEGDVVVIEFCRCCCCGCNLLLRFFSRLHLLSFIPVLHLRLGWFR